MTDDKKKDSPFKVIDKRGMDKPEREDLKPEPEAKPVKLHTDEIEVEGILMGIVVGVEQNTGRPVVMHTMFKEPGEVIAPTHPLGGYDPVMDFVPGFLDQKVDLIGKCRITIKYERLMVTRADQEAMKALRASLEGPPKQAT